MENAVETFNLTKSYGAVKALDSLNLNVKQGEILVLLGLIVNTVRIGPPLVLILWITGAPILMLLTSLSVLLAMSAGIMGIMISLSFIAFRSFDIYSAMVAGMSALLIRFSTILYPLAYMPGAYGGVSRANPLTYGADLLRTVLSINVPSLANPVLSAFVVLAVGISTLTIGMTLVPRVLEGVKSS